MDAIRHMRHGRHSLSIVRDRASFIRLRGRRGFMVLGFLALALAGCGSRSAPLSQPLDAGQPAGPGTDRQLAENGDHERILPNSGAAALADGNLLTNGTHQPVAGAPAPMPQQITPPGQAADDPTQPMGAEPLLDAGGFEPSPQGGGEVDHSSGSSESTTAGVPHS